MPAPVDAALLDGARTHEEAVERYARRGFRVDAAHRKLEQAPYDNLGLPWHPHTQASLEPLVPGEPALLSFDVLPISIVFAGGHRIRVVINFADTQTPAVRPAPTVTLYRDAAHASSITLPIVE